MPVTERHTMSPTVAFTSTFDAQGRTHRGEWKDGDVILQVRASQYSGEYIVSVSRMTEEDRGTYSVRSYRPFEGDLKTSSRVPSGRYSAKTLRAAFEQAVEDTRENLNSQMDWARAIKRDR
jgi:hypothetical protein